MSDPLSDLQAAVTATTNAEQSAIALIEGIAVQLLTLVNQAAPAGIDPATVEALATTLTTKASALAQAITANTPAAPVAVPLPVPPAVSAPVSAPVSTTAPTDPAPVTPAATA